MISQRRSLFYIVVAVLLATMTLAANTGAGPQKAMPPTPTKPMDQLTAQLQKLDPKAAIVRYVLYGDSEDEAKIVVQNAFHHAHYQERLQMAQSFWAMWKKLNGSSNASIIIVDIAGNRVGRVGVAGNAWVQKP
jgi:hypothetical protein